MFRLIETGKSSRTRKTSKRELSLRDIVIVTLLILAIILSLAIVSTFSRLGNLKITKIDESDTSSTSSTIINNIVDLKLVQKLNFPLLEDNYLYNETISIDGSYSAWKSIMNASLNERIIDNASYNVENSSHQYYFLSEIIIITTSDKIKMQLLELQIAGKNGSDYIIYSEDHIFFLEPDIATQEPEHFQLFLGVTFNLDQEIFIRWRQYYDAANLVVDITYRTQISYIYI